MIVEDLVMLEGVVAAQGLDIVIVEDLVTAEGSVIAEELVNCRGSSDCR